MGQLTSVVSERITVGVGSSESSNPCQVRGEESVLKVLVRTNPKTVTLGPDFHLVQEKILNMKVRSIIILLDL